MRFQKVLVANRGEIALRIIRTCHQMGYSTVAVYSDADQNAPFVQAADEAIRIGPPPSNESYLQMDAIIHAAKRSKADAIHPGYGFLAENAEFAETCEKANLVFIGPTAKTIRLMGSKVEARTLMAEHGVPTVPGYQGSIEEEERVNSALQKVGLPLLIKASAGGGGKGMRIIRSLEPAILQNAIEAAKRESLAAFGDDTLLFERYIETSRHIEVQILGDSSGNLVHLFERECSIQRRYQKIIEESPSTALDDALRAKITEAALTVGRILGYRSAGTVEFILSPEREFYFLEVNTRLQVEHPVTEMRTGLDLVKLQLQIAQGQNLPFTQEEIQGKGHAIECRIYAEDSSKDFLPSTGVLYDWQFSLQEGERLDAGVTKDSEVSIYYDPMLAKLITWGTNRMEATRKMCRALTKASILGVTTNQDFLYQVLTNPAWEKGDTTTRFIETYLSDLSLLSPDLNSLRHAAIASTLAEVESRRSKRTLLPQTPLGWRNNRWRMIERIWSYQEQEIEIYYQEETPGSFSVSFSKDETPFPVKIVSFDLPEICLVIDAHRQSFRIAWNTDQEEKQTFIRFLGKSVTLDACPRFPDTDRLEEKGTCSASMPGKILKVLVSSGEKVEEGQSLVILEAMKMEHTIVAPQDGTVRDVQIEEGQQVETGEALILFEE